MKIISLVFRQMMITRPGVQGLQSIRPGGVGGGMSPSHVSGVGSPATPAGISPLRRTSSSGVPSPAMDRPITPRTPNSQGGPLTPGSSGRPHTPGSAGRQTPGSAGRQTPGTPGPQPSPSPDTINNQQVGYQGQAPQINQVRMMNSNHGGGGGSPHHPAIPAPPGHGWGDGIFGLQGGSGPRIGFSGIGVQLGGWGYFVGLKGGSPPVCTPLATPQVESTTVAVAVTQAGPTTIVSSLPASSEELTPHLETSTSTSSVIVTRGSTQDSLNTTPSLSPAMSVNTTSSQASCYPSILNPSTAESKVQLSVSDPDHHKMPPSSIHQANIGIPGGLNSRQAVHLPRLPNQVDINNPSYPFTNVPFSSTGVGSEPSSVPPMPLVSNNPSQLNPTHAVQDSQAVSCSFTTTSGMEFRSQASFSSPHSTANNSTYPTSLPPGNLPFQSSTLSSSNFSLPTVNKNTTNIITQNIPTTKEGVRMISNLITTNAYQGPRMMALPTSNTSSAPTGDLSMNKGESTNVLLKQLLSSSTIPPKSDSVSSMSTTGELKEPPQIQLSSLASQVPSVSTEINQGKQGPGDEQFQSQHLAAKSQSPLLAQQLSSNKSSLMPHSMSSSIALGIPQGIPTGVSQSFSSGVSQGIPSGMLQSTPSGLPQSMQAGISQGMSGGTHPGMNVAMSSTNHSVMPSGNSSGMSASTAMTSGIHSSMSSGKMDQPANMQEGLAGMLVENSHKISMAKLPNQPVPPNSLAGVVQVQPNQESIIQRPPIPQQNVIRHMSGGIQNLLQSQVPVPPGQLSTQQHMQQQTIYQQQQQQLHQQKMQEQLRHQQLQMQQQQIRMQQQQHQQQQGMNFDPPQQIVGIGNRGPIPGQYPHSQVGMTRPMGQMQQMINQVSNPGIRHQMVGMVPGSRMPIHSGVTGGLRLNIPPHQMQMGTGAPCTPNSSTLPSPALTPRSENDMDDTGSSRGPTPGSDRMDGSLTPEMLDNKLKRRPSVQQQKRRISIQDGPQLKKQRPRKGSRLDEGDYDNYIDTVMHQLKNLPPIPTVEPRLSHCFNACSAYGTGDIAKVLSKENEAQKCTLDGTFGCGGVISEGDYYSTMPFGVEPPVPHIPPLSVNQRGFYNQEFTAERRLDYPRHEGYISPDLFYSSSPEPDILPRNKKGKKCIEAVDKKDSVEQKLNNGIKKEVEDTEKESDKSQVEIKKEPGTDSPEKAVVAEDNMMTWYDLEPDDTDEELENLAGPPNIMSRPSSPSIDIICPIPIKPKPSQSITLSDLTNLDKENLKKKEDEGLKKAKKGFLGLTGTLGIIPEPLKEKHENTREVTIKMSGGGSKSLFKALKGLAKILEIEPPKQWMQEDKSSKKAVFRVKRDLGKDGVPLDLQSVLNRSSKICRQCEMVIQHDMVKKKSSDLPFLTKPEKDESCDDLLFCDESCYLNFSLKKTGIQIPEKIKSLKQLEDYQTRYREEGCLMDTPKKDEKKGPLFKGLHYKNWTMSMGNQRKNKIMNEKDLTQMMFQLGITMMPPREAEDVRQCLFCHMRGDAAADGPARLLNYEVDKWVHLNCALWSEEVYETVSGALVNVETALKNSVNSFCNICEKNHATIKCFKTRCTNLYHLNCAVKDGCTFYKNKTLFCNQHQPKGEKDNELTTLAVYRRVYIERDENRQVANVMSTGMESNVLRIGALTFLSVGQLLPHQLNTFHSENFIYPIGYKILRFYWSMRNVNKRCKYFCSIADVDNRPEFVVEVEEPGHENIIFKDLTCLGAWTPILAEIEKLRKKSDNTKIFPPYISGEDLFGFTEPNIIKVLESLPGIESLTDYTFKYGRNPMLELPLAVNPTGCARSEPKLRTHVKRIHNFQRSTGATKETNQRVAKDFGDFLIGLETVGPYSKNFVQSKSSQYRKMKQEWRQNVVLARSKIQGLGLYAARDLEKGQMIIEYIGEVIRSNLTDIREKRYESQNRGIYMFRLDDERVVDATLSGGVARYINHR